VGTKATHCHWFSVAFQEGAVIRSINKPADLPGGIPGEAFETKVLDLYFETLTPACFRMVIFFGATTPFVKTYNDTG
jgi:hypothetical protein